MFCPQLCFIANNLKGLQADQAGIFSLETAVLDVMDLTWDEAV